MKRILVIDDEEWLREMVHMALAQKGFDVVEAENGEVGIDKARKELPDLIRKLTENTEQLDVQRETKTTFWDTWTFFLLS